MKSVSLFLILLHLAASFVEAAPIQNDTQATASGRIDRWQEQYQQYIKDTIKTRNSGCTPDNIVYRQEWGSLSEQSRIEYSKAVQCLVDKPALTPQSDVPGARSRFDDFFASHIIQSPDIHFSGLFFFWHRYYIWLYEKTLQEECGYTGTQPYWDWTLSYRDPRNSTVFDGSPTSMGSNGLSIPHGPLNVTAFGLDIILAPATGGGCVYSGPFANYTVNLGPHTAPDGGLAYNPRCLKRDLSLVWANQTKPSDVTSLFDSCGDSLECFGTTLQAPGGVHGGGHLTIGGDPGADFYASPGDPAFYLHHAQIDRVWTIWQALNAGNRTSQVYGTGTAFNNPPSPNVTLDSYTEFNDLTPHQKIGDLVSSIDGPFCYMYV